MKGEMSELLTDAKMSSEESDQEDWCHVYVVRTVPWKSEELQKRKRKLDRIHTHTHKKKSKRSQERAVKEVALS